MDPLVDSQVREESDNAGTSTAYSIRLHDEIVQLVQGSGGQVGLLFPIQGLERP